MYGLIYIMKMFNYYKVGIANERCDRFGEYTMLPEEPLFLNVSYCKDNNLIESYIGKEYSHKRIRGEWFSFDDNDLNEINKYINKRALFHVDDYFENETIPDKLVSTYKETLRRFTRYGKRVREPVYYHRRVKNIDDIWNIDLFVYRNKKYEKVKLLKIEDVDDDGKYSYTVLYNGMERKYKNLYCLEIDRRYRQKI